jgi:hypothetical protein
MKSYESKKVLGALICVMMFLFGAGVLSAESIYVANHSFELPYVGPGGAAVGIDSWGINGPNAGVAGNGWGGGGINLLNSDGIQIAWMNTYADGSNELASAGIWQALSDTYTVGKAYELTVGLARAAQSWNPGEDTDQIDIRLFYNAAGSVATIASVTATASELNYSNDGYLTDYTATLPVVLATDDWAGKTIGIWIVSSYRDPASDGGDWVVDNVRLNISDIAKNPDPKDGKTIVGIDTQLGWESPLTYEPIGYDLYIGTDPNAGDASQLGWIGTTITPATDMGYTLDNETTYYWRVDALEPNSPSPIVHTGHVWSFTTAPPVPIVTVNPVSQTVPSGTIIDLSVTALNTDSYTWYQSADVVADAGDTMVGSGQTIQVMVDSIGKEGWYYCVVSNTVDSDTSGMARVMTKRLVGYWDFEGDLADNVTGVPTHDGSATDPNFTAGVPEIGGQGYQFFGDGRIVTIADSNDYFNFYPQGLTISCWVKNQNPAVWDTVCSKEYERELGFSGAKGFYLGRSSAGVGAFAIRPYEATAGSFTIADWHQLVGVHDPAAHVIRVYVDGTFSGEVAANAVNFNKPNLAPLIFGAESSDGAIGASSATIDDLKIYNYALDSTQIAQQYVDVMGGYICVGGNPASDLSGDCQVNLDDLAILAGAWLNSNRIE